MDINNNNSRNNEANQDDAFSRPDPETLHTTDPQENMKGPVSSLMQEMKEGWEDASEDETPGQQTKKDSQKESE